MGAKGTRRIREIERPWRDPALLLLTGFGSGLAPRAPGTFGSLAALLLWWLLLGELGWPAQLLVVGIAFGLGWVLAERAARRLGIGDDPAIVIDEFAGMWIALAGATPEPLTLLAGFLIFRLFDIWKPWPISVVDRRVHGGLGVMLDDLLAGVFSWPIVALLAVWLN